MIRPLRPALALGLLLVTLPALAGCIETTQVQLKSAADIQGEGFDGTFHWPAPVATDDQGNPLSGHPLLETSAFPVAREQMLFLGGAEPNIGVIGHEDSNTTILVTTFDQVQRSVDYGQTWKLSHDFLSPLAPRSIDRFSTSDPMFWVDPDTQRAFASHMHPGLVCNYLAYSDDEGQTWSDAPVPAGESGVMKCGTPGIDHQKVMTSKSGPRANEGLPPAAPPQALRNYQNVLYLCYNKIVPVPPPPIVLTAVPLGTYCSVSYDSGRSFVRDVEVFPHMGDGCAGISGHPAADPQGRVYVPKGAFAAGASCPLPPMVAMTEDDGVSWTRRTYEPQGDQPECLQTEIDPDLTFTPDGTGYLLVRCHDQREYLFRSKDQFQTWEGPFRVAPADHRINVFAGITSGADGRIAMAYLGSKDSQMDPTKDMDEPPVEPSNVTLGTVWHLYVTVSVDAGADHPTFVTQQVTPTEDPVQIGCVWLRGGGGGPNACRNLLDFIDMGSDLHGRFYVAFTDGCSPRNGCTVDPEAASYQSRDREAAIAVQIGGVSLQGDQPLSTIALAHPQPVPRVDER